MIVCRDLDALPSFESSVITIGSFDGVHSGHREIIKQICQIAKQNSYVSIIVTFEPHPRLVLQPGGGGLKMLYSLEEKLDALGETDIDYVVIVPFTKEFASFSPSAYVSEFLVANFNPAHIVIGYDHRFGEGRKGDIELLKSLASTHQYEVSEIKAQQIDDIAVSSTKIRKALQDGDLDRANSYLNAVFPLTGKVVKGQQLGRELGFPTANLELDSEHKIIPSYGVYAAQALIDGVLHNGMLYIGTKPTIDGSSKEVTEINLFDFSQDLYGKKIKLLLHNYIRDDIKFANIESLKVQLGNDEQKVREIFQYQQEQQKRDDVAIVVLNYNGEEYLESFLPFMTDSFSEGKTSIYVIDNACTDGSISYLEEWHPEVKVIQLDKNYGFAGGYNKGLKHIDAKYYALVNSDLQVTDNWLNPIIHKMEADDHIAAVQPKVLSLERKDEFEYAGAAGGLLDILNYPFCRGRIFNSVEKDEQQYESELDIFWASGAAFVIRAELMNAFEGFDSDFFAHQEEIDLCWRLKNAGYRICYVPSSVVYHLGGGTLDYANPHKTYLNFRNNSITGFKNESLLALFWKVPVRFILDLISALKFGISGQGASGIAVLKAIGYMIGHPLSINQKRRKTARLLKELKIGQADKAGRIKKSIVWAYFIRQKKTYQAITS